MTLQPISVPVLSLHNHTINRGNFTLCQGINLQLYTGQVCHLVGANGTGKTTLLMQLAGLLPISADFNTNTDTDVESDNNLISETIVSEILYYGKVGLPIQPVYVSHQIGIHPDLTVEQNLRFLLNLYNITPTENDCQQALAWVGLDGYEQTPSHQLSAGQTRRVNLSRLQLMTADNSKLWLLDEPFTALDVEMVAKLQHRIQEFANSGGAVLMTSHQMANMDQIADFELDLSEFMYA